MRYLAVMAETNCQFSQLAPLDNKWRIKMKCDRIQILVLLLALASLVLPSPIQASVVCPYAYAYELNGQHYYTACRCDEPTCEPVVLNQLLIFDQQVQNLGCKKPGALGDECECKTSLVAVGGIFGLDGDLSTYYSNSKHPFWITSDDFVVAQFGANNYYFRTLTIAATNSKTGELQERSIAFPLTQKKVTEIAEKGISGQPVVFKETNFDGLTVSFKGTAFASVATDREIPHVAQISHIAR